MNIQGVSQVLVCIDCLRAGKGPKKGDVVNNDPPFALTVVGGDAVCSDHLTRTVPVPAPKALGILHRRNVVTTDESDRNRCCGVLRDADGFCTNRPDHPIFFDRRSF